MNKDFKCDECKDLDSENILNYNHVLYYLCDEWIWDWGGILMIAKSTNSEEMKAILPKKNRIIFINNQKKLPHCVTPVASYAKSDRFAVASFIGCNKPF